MTIEILMIGEPGSAATRTKELRLRGYNAWLATTETELTWLLTNAKARPSFSVVDLGGGAKARASLLSARAAVAAIARLPTVLVGAHPDEKRLFRDVIASLPIDAKTDAILEVLNAA